MTCSLIAVSCIRSLFIGELDFDIFLLLKIRILKIQGFKFQENISRYHLISKSWQRNWMWKRPWKLSVGSITLFILLFLYLTLWNLKFHDICRFRRFALIYLLRHVCFFESDRKHTTNGRKLHYWTVSGLSYLNFPLHKIWTSLGNRIKETVQWWLCWTYVCMYVCMFIFYFATM